MDNPGGRGNGGSPTTGEKPDSPHRLLAERVKKNLPGVILTVADVLNPLILVKTAQELRFVVKTGLPLKTKTTFVEGATGYCHSNSTSPEAPMARNGRERARKAIPRRSPITFNRSQSGSLESHLWWEASLSAFHTGIEPLLAASSASRGVVRVENVTGEMPLVSL